MSLPGEVIRNNEEVEFLPAMLTEMAGELMHWNRFRAIGKRKRLTEKETPNS